MSGVLKEMQMPELTAFHGGGRPHSVAEGVDPVVVQAAARGSEEAFAQIYHAHVRMVFNVAWRIVGSREDAEEVVQQAFLAVHRGLPEFAQRSSLKTWIYRIAVNCAINHGKQRARERDHRAAFEHDLKARRLQSSVPGPATVVETSDMVDRLLATLPDEQRVCLVLRSVECLSYQEIADLLGINLNTVRSRIRRGREALLAKREAPNGL